MLVRQGLPELTIDESNYAAWRFWCAAMVLAVDLSDHDVIMKVMRWLGELTSPEWFATSAHAKGHVSCAHRTCQKRRT